MLLSSTLKSLPFMSEAGVQVRHGVKNSWHMLRKLQLMPFETFSLAASFSTGIDCCSAYGGHASLKPAGRPAGHAPFASNSAQTTGHGPRSMIDFLLLVEQHVAKLKSRQMLRARFLVNMTALLCIHHTPRQLRDVCGKRPFRDKDSEDVRKAMSLGDALHRRQHRSRGLFGRGVADFSPHWASCAEALGREADSWARLNEVLPVQIVETCVFYEKSQLLSATSAEPCTFVAVWER